MKKLLLIKAGGTFEGLRRESGDFDDWTIRGMGLKPSDVLIVRVYDGEVPPEPEKVGGIVMTGSHAMVTDLEDWSEKLCPWIKKVVEKGIPFLGICYGHQLLARALGGGVGDHPRGPEVGTVQVALSCEAHHDPLFGGLPPSFPAHATHTQSVLELPNGARVLASSDHEPYHGVAFAPSVWGVQFHPEFDVRAMCFYIEAQAEKLKKIGLDWRDVRDRVEVTPEASGLLAQFTRLVAKRNV